MQAPRQEGSTPEARAKRQLRLAIDVGGTFTDVAILDELDGEVRFEKTATTPKDPAVGVIAAVTKAHAALGEIAYFVHGTTLALNAILTRSGASVALITTNGFRDVYELARTDRDSNYDLWYRRQPTLVPRRLIFEVDERMDYQGNIVRPFDFDGAAAVARAIEGEGVGSVAVCFLHSYANPEHEQQMGRVLRETLPNVEVTLSHELVREYREYERTSTAVVDAYVKPIIRRYLEHLRGSLEAADFGGRFLVIRSGGGAMTIETAMDQPSHSVLSGPAGGVIGASAFASLVDEPNLITIDMGGTSLDASLIVDGSPTTISQVVLQGQAVALPALNITTIGAGGGSIAWLDAAGHLQVGPDSAGADPGPVAYGQGGTEVTVTDAALAIGYLGEDTALGGELSLDRGLAQEAVDALAQRLGLSAIAVAGGIIELAITRVGGAVREITVERGHDPKGFVLLAYGGGGGLIAADVARGLRIPRVIVPPGPGAFSAFGMLLTDVIHDFAQTRVGELAELGPGVLGELFTTLDARGHEALASDGFAADRRELRRTAELRFAGQEHTVPVPVPDAQIDGDTLSALAEEFARLHEERYGHRMDDPVELVTARVRATGLVPRPKLPRIRKGGGHGRTGERTVVRSGSPVEYQVYWREHFGAGDRIDGPAIIEEYTATTIIGPDDVLAVGQYGELIIEVSSGSSMARGAASQGAEA
jgi:N-methylhydantoinase A